MRFIFGIQPAAMAVKPLDDYPDSAILVPALKQIALIPCHGCKPPWYEAMKPCSADP